jgi:hypothetical protein
MKPVDEFLNDIKGDIQAKVAKQTANMKEEIYKKCDGKVENLKTAIKDEVSEVGSKFAANTTNVVKKGIADYSIDPPEDVVAKDKSSAGGVKMNYKEYCKLFMFIKLLTDGGETAAMQRAAAIMTANVRYAKKNADENFSMTTAYTIINVHADTKMSTMFPWTVSVSEGDGGTGGMRADFSHLGGFFVPISYDALNGY